MAAQFNLTRRVAAAAEPMDRAGDQLLAGTGLAPDEDSGIGGRHDLDLR